MDDIKIKQQVIEKIKDSAKILVTVSDNPSVDALSAAIGLTMLLDKQEKYTTAIFSGETPPAIAFLEPQKTFDDTTDSLRDFIIALNKEKADHLRYKVEGDSVKIFITPYKTIINEEDLEFSQGDYNVELVIALGVDDQDHLDRALEGHGQILHDAAIITMTAGDQTSDLGGIDWHDGNSSSLSEMVTGLAEAIKSDRKKPLIDATIATALLTGVVAQTDRFSNEHTTSKAMTVAAQLMSAGADQQLIATELQATHQINQEVVAEEDTPADEPDSDETDNDDDEDGQGIITIKKDGFSINHSNETLAELDKRVLGEEKAKEKVIDEVEAIEEDAAAQEEAEEAQEAEQAEQAQEEAEQQDDIPAEDTAEEDTPADEPQIDEPSEEPDEAPEVETQLEDAAQSSLPPLPSPIQPVVTAPVLPELPALSPVAPAGPFASTLFSQPPAAGSNAETLGTAYAAQGAGLEPSMGGTLNATTEQAADDARREALSDKNKTILSHAYLGDTTAQGTEAAGFPGTPPVAPGSIGVNTVPTETAEVHSAYAFDDPSETEEESVAAAYSAGGEKVIQPIEEAASAEPIAPLAPPAASVVGFDLPLPPSLPDFSQVNASGATLPPLPDVTSNPGAQPGILGDIFSQDQPSVASAYSQPAQSSAYAFDEPDVPSLPEVQPEAPANPAQFKIPGQS